MMTNDYNAFPEYVVAIGASAGGLIPLQELIEALPDDIGDVAIVIAQHLSPEYKSMLTEIISRQTRIPTTTIVKGEKLEPNHIYVTPPNCDAIFKEGELHIVETTIGGPRPNIDRLFSTLAYSFKEKSVGIILSGTGHDGSKGVGEIKKVGGITICQDISSARYTGMPQSAINTNLIDVVLSASQIGSQLIDLITQERPIIKKGTEDTEKFFFESNDPISFLLKLLEEKVGTDFSNYKSSTIVRRIEKRLKELNFKTVEEYINHIQKHEDEFEAFYNYLLIGVTSFFRDEEAFHALNEVLRNYVIKLPGKSSVRVWVPGCATGEESVTIAIIFHELFNELNRFDIKLQIFATDINSGALKFARRGVYEKDKVEKLPENIIAKYFLKENNGYQTNLDIKNSILYTKHDITTNPPFLRLDLISCRNLFIYFNQSLQNQLFPIFQYALTNGGILFLGKSESIGNYKSFFDNINSRYRIFSKKEMGNIKNFKLPQKKNTGSERRADAQDGRDKTSLSVQEMIKETIFATYDKPYVIIDEHGNIIEISGNINPFISIRAGSANINLLRLIKEELHIELRAMLSEAINTKKKITGRLRRLPGDSLKQLIRLHITPVNFSKPGTPYYMIVFDKLEIDEPFLSLSSDNSDAIVAADAKRIQELEYELESNRSHMNTLVEELESTNEELQALNEELQSSNEELQASNEELETSNEELQATNEELENAYVDIRTASNNIARQKQLFEQVSLASPDLIAILRGDNLIFEFINSSYQQLFPGKTFMGLPFLQVMHEFADLDLYETIKQVRTERKAIKRGEVPVIINRNTANQTTIYLNFTFAPLISEDSKNKNADVILFADDVTDAIILKMQAEENVKFFSTLAGSLPQKVWIADKNGNCSYINQTFSEYFHVDSSEGNKIIFENFLHPDDQKKYKDIWSKSLENKTPFKIQYRFATGNEKYEWHSLDCRPLINASGEATTWICSATDIHEEKSIEQKKDEFMSIASHELKTPLTTIKSYLQLMEDVLQKGDCDKAYLYNKQANKGILKLSSLVEDLLDLTRIETGKLSFVKEKINFDDIVTEAIEEFKPLANRHQVIFEGKTTKAIVLADAMRITQVIFNMLNNAVKYSPGTDKIIVKTFKKNGNVFFEVQDFGIGIPATYAEKIFDRFFRINENDKSSSGLGIGLYISKEIIENHNGKIFTIPNQNKGSIFSFMLPVIAAEKEK